MSGWYDTFRHKPFPALYGPFKTPVTADVLEAGLLFAIAILAISFFLILPGLFLRKRLIFFLKVVFGLFILAAIFLCNFGQEWEVAHVHTRTQYKAGITEEIVADIEVKIGLRSVNITLKAGDDDHIVHFHKVNETVNYNERFSWNSMGWPQGRGGFGPFAGLVQREYRAAQVKGLPYPILWIAEYFTPDGEGIRWGRFYRQAGYYSHIMLWLAFPLYMLSVILVMTVRTYGGVFFGLTGLSMITANLIYGLVRNPTDLLIPFESGNLVFTWGWCFWLCLFTGLLNLLISFTILLLDCLAPDMLRDLLDVDVAGEYEQYFLSVEELNSLGINVPSGSRPKVSTPDAGPNPDELRYVLRHRATKMTKLIHTMRLMPDDAKRKKPLFVQQTNDKNRLFQSRQATPNNIQQHGDYQNMGQDNPGLTLDEIAAMTPDPEDMRALNIDPMHPDMNTYDNTTRALNGQDYIN